MQSSAMEAAIYIKITHGGIASASSSDSAWGFGSAVSALSA